MNTNETKTNIVFIIWDACRIDYAEQHAPNLKTLGESGVWFQNAISPSVWSLPSHASLFTGQYPSEHEMAQPSKSKMPTTLIEELKKKGYNCYGVSGNGFTSERWGFDEVFDQFRYTQGPEPYLDGREMYGFLRGRTEYEDNSKFSALLEGLSECMSHEKKLKSIANLVSVGINHASRDVFTPLQKIPHPIFGAGPRYAYSGEKNTALIKQILGKEMKTKSPFFIFTNYMETHRPFIPDKDLQRKHLGEVLDKEELIRLNEEAYLSEKKRREEDVQKLRSLYAAEVETVDRYLGELVEALKYREMFNDTLVVVTADHGDDLGEIEFDGERIFGHQASISENLSRVPLVVSHPGIIGRDIGSIPDYISTRKTYEIILNSAVHGEVEIEEFCEDEVLCEYPATGNEEIYEGSPNEFTMRRFSRDMVSAHSEGWRIVADSRGEKVAYNRGNETELDEAPEELIRLADYSLDQMSKIQKENVSAETAQHLEELGYL
jgi:membrane-anchored protein YejM (alkaline phosphatase superfamily)